MMDDLRRNCRLKHDKEACSVRFPAVGDKLRLLLRLAINISQTASDLVPFHVNRCMMHRGKCFDKYFLSHTTRVVNFFFSLAQFTILSL